MIVLVLLYDCVGFVILLCWFCFMIVLVLLYDYVG